LNCFAESHLICKDSVNSGLVKTDHPVQTVKLVVAQRDVLYDAGLCVQTSDSEATVFSIGLVTAFANVLRRFLVPSFDPAFVPERPHGLNHILLRLLQICRLFDSALRIFALEEEVGEELTLLEEEVELLFAVSLSLCCEVVGFGFLHQRFGELAFLIFFISQSLSFFSHLFGCRFLVGVCRYLGH